MNIHVSFFWQDSEFVLSLLHLLLKDNHGFTATDYKDADAPNAVQKRRSDTEQKIERADLVIGVASQAVFAEAGIELRHHWNAILINRRPSFMLVHEQRLPFISHAFTSVRRTLLHRADINDPVVPGSLNEEFLRMISDTDLARDFERFTYIHPLLPH